ncbi:MAG: c-type cytochrome domain-containing protein [Caldilineaceae bacterium]
MTNTNRSQRPPQAKRRARRSSLGCSLAFVAVLVLLAGGVLVLGPRLLDRLLGAPATGAPATLNDPTSPEKLAALRQQADTQLSGYGWVNQAGGLAHIPINRAIALVAEKRLPVGKPPATPPPATNEAATSAPTTTVDLANVSFTNDVLPIFQQHCLKCHGNDNPEKGLELTSYSNLMTGAEDGSVVTPGDPDKSYLVEMVVTKKMPKKGAPLSATEINTIIAWVKAGAKDDTGTAPKKTTAQATAAVTATTTAAPVDLANVSFKTNVLPIFQQHCQKCHGSDNPEKGLEMTSYSTLMTGAEDGTVVEPGAPDKSYLVEMVVSKKMPKKGPPLSAADIQTITAWIKAGAKDN